jgi:hypothetical protein
MRVITVLTGRPRCNKKVHVRQYTYAASSALFSIAIIQWPAGQKRDRHTGDWSMQAFSGTPSLVQHHTHHVD